MTEEEKKIINWLAIAFIVIGLISAALKSTRAFLIAAAICVAVFLLFKLLPGGKKQEESAIEEAENQIMESCRLPQDSQRPAFEKFGRKYDKFLFVERYTASLASRYDLEELTLRAQTHRSFLSQFHGRAPEYELLKMQALDAACKQRG